MKKISGPILAVIVFILSLGLVLTSLEIYYRFIFDSTDSFGLTLTTRRWFDRYYKFNDLGVRDNIDFAEEPTPGKHRITFIGDSFTAGHGVKDVNQRFVNIIRREMAPDVEIQVLASNGWDTGQEINSLDSLITKHGYKMGDVVLVYCLNDISDIAPEWGKILERILSKKQKQSFLIEHSYALNILYYRLKAIMDPDISNYYGFVKNAYGNSVLLEQQIRRLNQMKQLVESNGGHFMVVTFPFLNALGPKYPYHDIHKTLEIVWKELGVPPLDLYSIFEKYKPSQVTVNRFDAHPNPFAHQLAADAIIKWLKNSPAIVNHT